MNTVIKKLEITAEQYESILWNFYANWCENVTENLKEYQKVLANASINAWFRMELEKCEDKFHEMTDRYVESNVSAKDYERCYRICLVTLFNIRPVALLNQIIKRKSPPKGIKAFSAN